MRFVFTTMILLSSFMLVSAKAGEIGYVEDFALAKDRAEALKQLIPGTQDYYYYHALHYQNIEQFDRVDAILKPWIKRYKYSARVNEILNRQALLTYEKNSKESLAHLQRKLGLHFNHQREVLSRKPNLRTELDQNLISRATTGQASPNEPFKLGRLREFGARLAGEAGTQRPASPRTTRAIEPARPCQSEQTRSGGSQ